MTEFCAPKITRFFTPSLLLPFFPYLFRLPKGAPGGKDEEKGRRGEGVKSRVFMGAQNSAALTFPD